jgi:hypothetical protein
MRQYNLALQVAVLGILLAQVEGSAIFSFEQTHGQSKKPISFDNNRRTRRQRQPRYLWHNGRATPNALRVQNADSMLPNYTGMPLAFSARHGGWFLVAASLGYIGKKIEPEAVSRALYFWIHAGPIVMHYKFTRWFLHKTKAPLEKRDKVYNTLHEKYCNKTMDIVLHLKGEFLMRNW